MSSVKTKYNTIVQYIDSFPEDIQKLLKTVRKTINKAIPHAEQTISYQIPTFKLDGKVVLHFAAFKKHIGFHPTPSGNDLVNKEK
jgi:uncharacterized protein YdhG (YjbR/CyaY superfamily)